MIGSGNINITGNDLDNVIIGNSGNNIINGGLGNDTLIGGDGSDIYIYNLGDGSDTFISYDGTNGNGISTMQLGAGITSNTITYLQNGQNLILKFQTGEMITMQNWFSGSNYQVVKFQFADGIQLTPTDISSRVLGGNGTDGNDTLVGDNNANKLDGLGGDDLLYGNGGNDTLYGGDGNDYLDGGVGADTMIGGTGNDTYIVDNYADVVTEVVNEGIDTVTVQSSIFYTIGANVENLTLLGTANLDGMGNSLNNIIIGNSGCNIVYAYDGDDVIYGGDGNDRLYGYNNNDTLYGGNGDDYLDGGNGNDYLEGDAGNDTLCGGNGNDTLHGGAGNDYLQGNGGANTYIYNLGDGNDTIENYEGFNLRAEYLDTLRLGAGITANNITYLQNGGDLILKFKTGETLTIIDCSLGIFLTLQWQNSSLRMGRN